MYTPETLLDATLEQLREQLGSITVDPWFKNAQPLTIENGLFVIEAASELFQETLTARFTDNVTEIITYLLKTPTRPLYVFGPEANSWRLQSDTSVYAGYTFERFIVGNSNKFAHAAALAVANKPATLYNPLFIYGGSGLGKTHLLLAIAGHIRKTHPTFRILYIKSEDFMNDMLEAMKVGFADFYQKYRQVDLLLMDDAQFLTNKMRMQEEFFHTFETLYQAGKQIVLTSDRPPKEIATLNERLRTRFESGLMADIQSPDLETRMAMIQSKASGMNIQIPQKVVTYIAENVTHNVRELEGAVKKIAAIHTLMGRPIDTELAQEAIRDIFRENPGLHPSPDMILKEVAEYFVIDQSRLTSKGRSKDIVVPRQVACYLMREIGNMSYPEIGKVFGQHHTSIIYGVEKLTDAMKTDESLRNKVTDLQTNITQQ